MITTAAFIFHYIHTGATLVERGQQWSQSTETQRHMEDQQATTNAFRFGEKTINSEIRTATVNRLSDSLPRVTCELDIGQRKVMITQ